MNKSTKQSLNHFLKKTKPRESRIISCGLISQSKLIQSMVIVLFSGKRSTVNTSVENTRSKFIIRIMVIISYELYQTTNTVFNPEHNWESDFTSVTTWIQVPTCLWVGTSACTTVEKLVLPKFRIRRDSCWVLPSMGVEGLIPRSLVSPGTVWFADPRSCEHVQEKNHFFFTFHLFRHQEVEDSYSLLTSSQIADQVLEQVSSRQYKDTGKAAPRFEASGCRGWALTGWHITKRSTMREKAIIQHTGTGTKSLVLDTGTKLPQHFLG